MGGPAFLGKQWHARYRAQRVAEFGAYCREQGLAVTPQRVAIIRALLSAEDHPRADQIYARVRRQHPHISLTTVYRTLEQFCEMGQARKVTLLHEGARYDGNITPHHHVLCVGCQRVFDIALPEADGLLHDRERLGEFVLLRCLVEIQVLCGQCRRKGQNSTGARPRRQRPVQSAAQS